MASSSDAQTERLLAQIRGLLADKNQKRVEGNGKAQEPQRLSTKAGVVETSTSTENMTKVRSTSNKNTSTNIACPPPARSQTASDQITIRQSKQGLADRSQNHYDQTKLVTMKQKQPQCNSLEQVHQISGFKINQSRNPVQTQAATTINGQAPAANKSDLFNNKTMHSPNGKSMLSKQWQTSSTPFDLEAYQPANQATNLELQDEDFWKRSAPPRKPSKMGAMASKLNFHQSEREIKPIRNRDTGKSRFHQCAASIRSFDTGTSTAEEDPPLPVFIPDHTPNTRARTPLTNLELLNHQQSLEVQPGVRIPPFELERLTRHFQAPRKPTSKDPFCWTILSQTQQHEAFHKLKKFRHGSFLLSKNHYRTDTYVKADDLDKHRRCKNCQKAKKNAKASDNCRFHLDKVCGKDRNGSSKHSCCGRLEPCQVNMFHHWEDVLPILHEHFGSFIETQDHEPTITHKRKALILDCEMVGITHNLSEIARLCVVDYLTGEVLIDAFVDPKERVLNYRTEYSGITPGNIAKAKRDNNCFGSWQEARDALLYFVDDKTILVGAALQNDLEILRLVHLSVADSSIISQQKVGSPWHRNWSLKTLCREMLDLDIQQSKTGHDPLEDCLATREIVLWMTYLSGNRFEEWAIVKRKEEERRYIEEKRKAEEKREKEQETKRAKEDEELAKEMAATGKSRYQLRLEEDYGYGVVNHEDNEHDGPTFEIPQLLYPRSDDNEW